MEMSLTSECKITKVADGASSAGTTVTSAAIDMQGYDAVCIFSTIATANAGNYLKLQQSSDDGSTDTYDDVAGSKVVADDGADVVCLDVRRPAKRYLKALIVRGGANTACGDIYAIRYNSRKGLQVNDVANAFNLVTLNGPAEGTP